MCWLNDVRPNDFWPNGVVSIGKERGGEEKSSSRELYPVCHKLFDLFCTDTIQIVTEYQIFEPSELFVFYHKYLVKDGTNIASFIMNFST
jgi:hypothetical protein